MSRRAYPCTKCNELFFLYRELEKHMKNTHKLVKIWKWITLMEIEKTMSQQIFKLYVGYVI